MTFLYLLAHIYPTNIIISVETTLDALTRVKVNKATGPDDIPAWVIRNNADVLLRH